MFQSASLIIFHTKLYSIMSVALLTNAQEKAASREYEAAENLFREYLKENETDAAAWAELGYVLLKQQKLYESGDAYAAAYDLEPENPKYISLLGNALDVLHQFEEAKLLFEKASNISGNPRCHIRVGDMLGKMGKYDEALVLYSLLAADHPDDPTIQHRMVRVYEALGRPADASAALAREMELREKIVTDSPSAKDWLMYADTKARLALWADAEAAFRKSLALQETAEIHMRIGAVLVMQKKMDEGLAEFAKAAAFDSEDFAFLMMQADVLTRLELFEESIHYYSKALELRSVHADAWAGIAYDLLRMGQIDEAKAFFEMAKASSAVRELPWADKLHKSEKTNALDAALKE